MKVSDQLMEKVKQHFRVFTTKKVMDPIGRRPIGIVAIGKTKDGVACRGVAICSATQTFDQAEGEVKALGRMIAAAEKKETRHPIVMSEEVKAYRKLMGEADSVGLRLRTPILNHGFVRGYSIARFQLRSGCPFRFKSYYNARLTEAERKALKSAKG